MITNLTKDFFLRYFWWKKMTCYPLDQGKNITTYLVYDKIQNPSLDHDFCEHGCPSLVEVRFSKVKISNYYLSKIHLNHILATWNQPSNQPKILNFGRHHVAYWAKHAHVGIENFRFLKNFIEQNFHVGWDWKSFQKSIRLMNLILYPFGLTRIR